MTHDYEPELRGLRGKIVRVLIERRVDEDGNQRVAGAALTGELFQDPEEGRFYVYNQTDGDSNTVGSGFVEFWSEHVAEIGVSKVFNAGGGSINPARPYITVR